MIQLAEDVLPASAPVAAPSEAPGQAAPTDAGVSETTQQAAPEGTLPADVHPAVRAERERAKRYRDQLNQLVVLDEQGNIAGLRPEVVEQVRQHLGGAQPSQDPNSQYRQRIEQWANQLGFLPDQVDGIVRMIDAISTAKADAAMVPVMDASIEQVKAALIRSDVVPREAAPFVARWIELARKANPRALLTQQGRATVLRQALGEWYIRSNSPKGTPKSPTAPAMLRPTPGSAADQAPTAEEAELRRKMGLDTTKYGATGPRRV